MEQEARLTQNEIQEAHEERRETYRARLNGHEPLYGLAPEPGGGGPASVGDRAQPSVEAPVEEPASAQDQRLNMTWGIVFGGLLLLILLVAILLIGVGNTYVSSPFTTYPLK